MRHEISWRTYPLDPVARIGSRVRSQKWSWKNQSIMCILSPENVQSKKNPQFLSFHTRFWLQQSRFSISVIFSSLEPRWFDPTMKSTIPKNELKSKYYVLTWITITFWDVSVSLALLPETLSEDKNTGNSSRNFVTYCYLGVFVPHSWWKSVTTSCAPKIRS